MKKLLIVFLTFIFFFFGGQTSYSSGYLTENLKDEIIELERENEELKEENEQLSSDAGLYQSLFSLSIMGMFGLILWAGVEQHQKNFFKKQHELMSDLYNKTNHELFDLKKSLDSDAD